MPTPRIPPLLSTYRGLRYPTSPLGSLEVFGRRAGETYEVYTGPSRGWALMTTDADLIDHVLRANHRNYGKSPIVTELLASYIGTGLLTSEGDYWRRQRRLIQPGFSRERLAALVALIDAEAVAWVDGLTDRSGTRPTDLYATTLPLALQIMAQVLFSGSVTPAELHAIARAVELGQEDFARELRQPLLRPWRRLTNSRAEADRQLAAALDVLLRHIEAHRAAPGGTYVDLMQMLLDARYDDGAAMSDRQLIDETLVLILAGHETTAISLACTLHLLAAHPDWQRRVRAEWRAAFPDGTPAAAGLRQLPVLTAVLREGLRLYPPAYLVSRRATADDRFGDTEVRAGQIVVSNVYGAHRNPRFFRDPLAFRPERYLDRETNANFAFGGGPRLCVGYHLAMMELQIAVGRLLDAARLAPSTTEGRDRLRFAGSATLRPLGGVWVDLIADPTD